jgi:hypothetical protein
MSDQDNDKMHYAGGAKVDHEAPAFRLIPAVLLQGAGRAYAEGTKYNEGLFESNWKKGNAQFYAERFDHLIEHLFAYWTLRTDPGLAEVLNYDREEYHLGHAAANLGFLMYGDAMGFFNEARDPGAPGYQYPFVPSDIPEEYTEPPSITEMIAKAEDTITEMVGSEEASEKAEAEGNPENWFKGLVDKATKKLTLEAVE